MKLGALDATVHTVTASKYQVGGGKRRGEGRRERTGEGGDRGRRVGRGKRERREGGMKEERREGEEEGREEEELKWGEQTNSGASSSCMDYCYLFIPSDSRLPNNQVFPRRPQGLG